MYILRIFLTESDQNIQFRRIVISLNFEFLTSLKRHKMLPPTPNIIGTFNALKKGGGETCHTFLSLLSVMGTDTYVSLTRTMSHGHILLQGWENE